MTKLLGLNDSQQAQIWGVLKAEREKRGLLLQKLMENRKQLVQAEQTNKFDEAAVRAIAAAQGQVLAELTVARARTRNQILSLLTPGQRALEEEELLMQEEGPGYPLQIHERRVEHRQPWGERVPPIAPPFDEGL